MKPSDIGSIAHWYRSDFGVELSGSHVTSITDLIGNVDGTESGVHTPVYVPNAVNGKPKIRFGADSQQSDPGNFTDSIDFLVGNIAQPFTVFMVWQQWNWQGIGAPEDPTGDASKRLVISDVSSSFNFHVNYNATVELNAGVALTGNSINNAYTTCKDAFGVTLLKCDGANSAIINNGIVVAQGNAGSRPVTSSLHISGRDEDYRDAAFVDFVEVAVFTGSLTTLEMHDLTSYAMKRYAIS